MYNVLRAEIERQKQLKGLTNADIAKAVGRQKNTVDIFMMNSPPFESKKLAEDIANYLGIECTEQSNDNSQDKAT